MNMRELVGHRNLTTYEFAGKTVPDVLDEVRRYLLSLEDTDERYVVISLGLSFSLHPTIKVEGAEEGAWEVILVLDYDTD